MTSATLGARIALAALGLALSTPAFAQTDGVLTRQYEDGGMYEGEFRDGLQHGVGTYRLPNGFEYTGDWVAGEISGQGVARYPSGAVYEGSFAAGRPHGTGKMTFADGSTYEGNWEEGTISGQGVRVFANESVYEGSFADGQPHGKAGIEPRGQAGDCSGVRRAERWLAAALQAGRA